MKKLLLLATLFCFSFNSYSQVTSVDFILDYDTDDGTTYYYNANLLINSGSATTASERIQFNTQYSLAVSTGAEVIVEENYMPLLNNTNYTGTEPIDWQIGTITISPAITPDKDYISITPYIDIASYHYNNLATGDIIPIFRIAVSNINCPNDVRLFENGVDPSSIELDGGTDFSNGITVGAPNQLYSGNQPSNISITEIEINDSEMIKCAGDCVTITPDVLCAPLDLTYLWSTGETSESITICPNIFETYTVTVTGLPGSTENASIFVNIEEDVIYFDNDVEVFCIGQSYFPVSEFGYDTWASSDESIGSFDNNELLIHAEGTFFISTTSPLGCVTELEITTSPLPVVAFEGPIEICFKESTQLSPNTGVVWTMDNPNIATVDNSGNVTGVGAGITYPTVTDLATGCSATSDIPIVVFPEPIIQNNGSFELCIGETTLMASADNGTWESSAPMVASIDINSGLVTALLAGEATFTFTENVNGCTNTTNDVIVNPLPSIVSGAANICIGETTQLSPTTGGTWISDNPTIASISNAGIATGLSSGIVRFYFTNNTTGCSSLSSNPTSVDICMVNPSPQCSEADVICDMDLLNNFVGTMSSEESGGNQPDPLCPGAASVANNISWIAFVAPDGDYTITVTPMNCTGAPNGNEGIQIGLYTDCTFEESVFCQGECSTNSVTFDSDILESGQTYYFFIDGCLGSVCEYDIEIFGNYISQCDGPCGDANINTEWEYVLAGEFVSDLVINTYTTGTNLLSTDDLDHLVYYEQVEGVIVLKENNGNGYLDNDIFLFYNENHYGLGNYNLYLEDIDNDGLTDIILAESGIVTMAGEIGDEITVLQNMGEGNFVLQIKEQVCGMEGPNNLKIADFDNDGMKDIFFVCADFLYDILWINDWNDTELTNFNSQTFCHVYIGDFNQDGFQDIGLSHELALINNGDRTFNNQDLIAIQAGCSSLTYFVEESNTILDPYNASIIDPSDMGTQLCSEYPLGDNENEIFTAYIFSPDVESIIVPQVDGFHFVDPNSLCSISEDATQIPNVVARQNTKIDLTLNGCSDFLVIENYQIFAWINPKQSTKILGTAFIDDNANGIYDSNELPLRNVLVSIAPGDFSVLTDDDGNYSFSVPPGTYTITANVNEGEWIESELLINNIQISDPCNEGYNFGFVPNSGPAEMATLSMVNTIARCDFETRFTITVENTGAEPLEGSLVFTFDDQTNFFSSDISGYQVIGNTVSANIGTLAPFSPQTYKVVVKMPSGSSNLPMLAFDAKLYDSSGNLIEEYGYSDQLRCSYDPNDKREYPDREGDDNLTLMDEDLEYTIRFQNNGNDTAFQVKIVDPLDSSIDPSTIRVMNSSHPVETCIEGTDLIFLFDDILLVDSMTNYPGSQGYVTFRCNTKDGVAEFTPVHNQADIIFDTNSPIVTNQTINTLVSVLCTDKETFLSAEICDGDSYEGYTESGTYTNIIALPFGCDSVITIELDVQGITIAQNSVDICEGESIFFNGVSYDVIESTQLVDSVYNAIGCISDILTLQVNVTQVSYSEGSFSVCEGDAITINGNNYTFAESTEIIDSSFNEDGCVTDIKTFQITVYPTIYEQLDTTICEGFDYEGLTVSGTYTIDSFDLATGCQLEFTINLQVLPANDPLCTVGIDDLDANLVKLYPNPASESIFVETENVWESIRIVDTQGKIVSSINQAEVGKLEVNVSQYISGVYMIIFQDGEKNLSKRFVVR